MLKSTERPPYGNGIPQELVAGILRAIRPEKIICFGMRSKQMQAWSCFLADKETKTATSYDIIILTRPNEQRPRHELLDIVDSLNTQTIKLNALIHNVTGINEAVGEGNLFFSRIYTEGLVLYDNQNIPLNQPVERYDLKTTGQKANKVWAKHFGLAQNFLAAATHLLTRGCNELSAFMLHQAVEHTCIALSRVATGYRPNTHNLCRLITMVENFDPFYPTIFPRNTKEEIHLFKVLSRAYSDARYNEIYSVTKNEITSLTDRVSAFQGHAESLYHAKIKNGPRLLSQSKKNSL